MGYPEIEGLNRGQKMIQGGRQLRVEEQGVRDEIWVAGAAVYSLIETLDEGT